MSSVREAVREAILAAEDLKKVEVKCPEWGDGPFFVRELSGAERGQLEQEISKVAKAGKLREGYRTLLVISSLVDAEGARIFEFSDLDSLNAKSGRALERIAAESDRLNALSEAEVDQLAKN